MKKTQILAAFALVATLFVLALMLGDFLALTDIHHEYVSLEVIDSLGVRLSDELPDWTATAGEWAMVQFSYVVRFAFLALNVVALSVLVAVLRKQDPERQEPA